MRLIGVAERALEKMCRRVKTRTAFGRPIAEQSVTLERIAESRIRSTRRACSSITPPGSWTPWATRPRAPRSRMIKIAAADTACQVIDWAIQAHGAAGLSDDFHLGHAYAQARAIRIADGPDEVHRNQIGRLELEKY